MKPRVRSRRRMKPMEGYEYKFILPDCTCSNGCVSLTQWWKQNVSLHFRILLILLVLSFPSFQLPRNRDSLRRGALQYYDSPKETIRCTKDGKGKGGVGHVLKINLNHNGHLNVDVEERRILIPSPSSVKCRLKVGVECSLFVCVRKGLEGSYFFTRPSMVDFKYGFRDA